LVTLELVSLALPFTFISALNGITGENTNATLTQEEKRNKV